MRVKNLIAPTTGNLTALMRVKSPIAPTRATGNLSAPTRVKSPIAPMSLIGNLIAPRLNPSAPRKNPSAVMSPTGNPIALKKNPNALRKNPNAQMTPTNVILRSARKNLIAPTIVMILAVRVNANKRSTSFNADSMNSSRPRKSGW